MRNRPRLSRRRVASFLAWAALAGATLACVPGARAGGGGENMLLVVNPNEEWAVRIANAYAQARAIPANNIVYLAPTTTFGYSALTLKPDAFVSQFQTPILNAISARGLSNQIDYIGTLGEPQRINGVPTNNVLSFNYAVDQMTQYAKSLAAGAPAANAMTAHQIPWVEESSATPKNRSAVRGAVMPPV